MKKLYAYSKYWKGETLISETPLPYGVYSSINGREIIYLIDVDLEEIMGLKREPDYDIVINEAKR